MQQYWLITSTLSCLGIVTTYTGSAEPEPTVILPPSGAPELAVPPLTGEGIAPTAPAADAAPRPEAAPVPPELNHYWKLVELRGEAVVTPEGSSEVHLTFRDAGKVDGFLGCNNFTAVYEIPAPGRLQISQAVLTQKMCLNAAVVAREAELAKVLTACDSYRISDTGKLMLLRARLAPLAVFEAVHMH
jgi:heat shock protein HslJ